LAAVVGKREIMNATDPKTGKASFMGTYNAHQVSLAAANATLTELRNGRVQKQLHQSTQWLTKRFEKVSSKVGIRAVMQGIGGKFQVYFTNDRPVDYRTAISGRPQQYAAYHRAMLDSRILLNPSPTSHQGITSAHTRDDLEAIITGMEKALENCKGV
jgi:glutamate-1-semialdehyde 2,1-aminomutase